MGVIVGTPNPMGTPLTMAQAQANIFGFVLLNDWSARDVQVWEYQPLGPFQAKAFATTISPWVVTQEALEPFRVQGPKQQPAPLPYLAQRQAGNYDIKLKVDIQTQNCLALQTISLTNFKGMYWSSAQQLAHHSSSGCAMQTGDLLGSGTHQRFFRQLVRAHMEWSKPIAVIKWRGALLFRRWRYHHPARALPRAGLSDWLWCCSWEHPTGSQTLS